MSKQFLTKEQQDKIVDAIKTAEKETSGEIRVHFQARCGDNPSANAEKVFKKLKMYETKEQNGVLFFVVYKSKKFTILGDKGIDAVVPDDFWQQTVATMEPLFKEGKFTEAVVAGILRAGEALKKFFPYQQDDVNELDNEVSYA